ncbi:MAG: hypothetical protein JNK72_12665 [Myxococcales bacterium]|nr:hypothetical protein [Myxococcales bacterium]
MRKVSTILFAALVLSMGCAEDPTCKEGCDRVRACGLSTSGLTCSTSTTGCATNENGCAACLNDKTCDEIRAGGCATACPGYRP